jgi:hypothetical protein
VALAPDDAKMNTIMVAASGAMIESDLASEGPPV